MSARRRRRGSPHCDTCHAVITFFTAAMTGKRRPFDPTPIDRAGATQRIAYPVENNTHWWHPRDLVEDLMIRHQQTQEAAEREVDDMPWHTPHRCPQPHEQESTHVPS